MIITSSQASWSWRHGVIRKSASLQLLTQNLQAALEIKIQVIPVIDKFGKHYLDHKIIGPKLSTGFLKVVVYFLFKGFSIESRKKALFSTSKSLQKNHFKIFFLYTWESQILKILQSPKVGKH